MSIIIIHPQGAVREIPEAEVESYLVLGWQIAAEQPAPEQPSMSWRRDELVAYAAAYDIDLGSATTKAQILAAIEAGGEDYVAVSSEADTHEPRIADSD